ncbi:hypothetical protein [Legionella fairfieldensis]|uniref:hypothetical protein n=1 Tax=Legionella fairfieldensis TaxID=45064 RepID=UPI00048AB001|nr:hypothetical protein [Legionella fairfieldensis]
MEHDRYEQNSKLFVIGLLCLLLSLTLLAFGLYILPYLLWNWRYDIPDFVLSWREWLKEYYNFTDSGASWLIFLVFFIPAIICGFISRWASNYIDNQINGIVPAPEPQKHREEIKRDLQESFGFGLKIFLLIILVLVAVTALEWLIASPNP